MAGAAVQQMADRVAALLEERLHVGGVDLDDKLRRARGRLPRAVRRDAQLLADAARRARSPKLWLTIDHAQVAAAYDRCLAHLNRMGAWDRRVGYLLQVAGTVSIGLLLGGALLLSVLVWRGFI